MHLLKSLLTRPLRPLARRFSMRLLAAGAVALAWTAPGLGQSNANWTAGTGNWTTAANWNPAVVPNNGVPGGSTYNAILDGLNGNVAYTVTLNSAITVSALTINSSFATLSHTAGIFQTTTGTISAGTYLLNGGTIKGGTWTISGTGSMGFGPSGNNALDGVTFASNSGINLSAAISYVRLLNGTNFAAGTTLPIGNNGALAIGQSQVVDNIAVTLNTSSFVAVEGNTSAMLGSAVTISQAASTTGYVGQAFSLGGTGNLTSQGTIQVLTASATTNVNPSGSFTNSGTLKVGGAAGSILNINPGGSGVAAGSPTWTNSGTGLMVVDTNGTLNLNGRMTTAGLNLPGISRLGTFGTINVIGNVDNTVGGPFALTATTGTLNLTGGTIAGGNITSAGGAAVAPNTNNLNQFSGVTVGSGALVLTGSAAYLRFTNGSTFQPGAVLNIGAGAVLGIGQTQAMDNVAITLNGSSILSVEGATAAVLGSATTLSQAASTSSEVGRAYHIAGTGHLTNQGTIQSTNTGAILTLNPNGTFTNTGTLRAGGGSAPNGGTVTIGPLGTGVAAGDPTWSNTGNLIVDSNGIVNLAGRVTTAGLNLPGIQRLNTGGVINLSATVNNAAATLALTATTGSLNLTGGTIAGGNITSAGGAAVAPNTNNLNQFSGVTVGSGALVLTGSAAYLRFTNGSTFQPGAVLNIGAGAVLGIGQTQAMDNVAITLNGSSILSVEGATAAVLGSATTLSQAASTSSEVGRAYHIAGTGHLTNQGTIQSTNTGAILTLNPNGTFTNTGTLRAGGGSAPNGGTVTIGPLGTGVAAGDPTWSNTGNLIVDSNGIVNLAGRVTTAGLNLPGIQRLNTGGAINLSGTLNNSTATLALTATTGSLNLTGGTIAGGTITSAGGAAVIPNTLNTNRFSGVTVGNGGLVLTGAANYVRFINASTFQAGAVLNIGAGAVLGIGQTQAVDNVAITLNGNSFLAVEGSIAAVLGPAVSVTQAAGTSGEVGRGYWDPATGHLTNQGTIQAIATGAILTINPTGTFTNSGTLRAGGGSAPNGGTVTIGPLGTGVAAADPTWSNTGNFIVDSNGILNLGGRVTTAGLNLPGFQRLNTGGAINLSATLNNAAATLALTATTGSINLTGGTIAGGTITSAGGAAVIPNTLNTNRFSGVTVGNGGLVLTGAANYVRFINASTFQAGAVLNIGAGAVLGIGQTQAVDNVAITLNGNSFLAVEGSIAAVLGPAVSVTQAAGTSGEVGRGYWDPATGHLTNQGTIQAIATGAILTINPTGTFTNTGTLRAGGGSAPNGGTVTINPGGTGVLATDPTWSNTGNFIVDSNGILNLGGRVTTAGLNLPGIQRLNAGGTINLTATVNNNAATFALTSTTGSLNLTGGTIAGGTINSAGGATLVPNASSANQLSGVTVNSGALNLSVNNAYVRLTNGSAFQAGTVLPLATGSILGIAQTQALDNLTITLSGASQVAVEGTTAAVLGPAVTVSQAASTSGNVGSAVYVAGTGSLTNQGLIQANAIGAFIAVNPSGTLTNSGTLLAGNGGTINVPNATTLGNLTAGTLTGGTYIVQGGSTMNFNTRTIATIGAGTTVTLDGVGSVFVAANTITANAGTFNLLNGRAFTVGGGTLTNTGTLQVGTTASLTGNVNSTAGTVSGSGTVTGNVVFDGTGNHLRPGTSPGNLTVAGNLTLNATTTFHTELNGTTFGTQYDRVTVTGAANTVTLAGAALNATLGFDPAIDTRLFVIDNQTNNAVTGTFAGLTTSGSTFQLTNPGSGNTFTATIFYAADTSSTNLVGGNDVVIVFTPVPEPACLLGVTFLGLALVRARRGRKLA